jgi:uncharacterized phiE125 gp8 family phage protein
MSIFQNVKGNLNIVVEPGIEPISYEEACNHLKISTFDESVDLLVKTKVENLIKAVRIDTERYLGRALITQTWRLYLDYFPSDQFITIPLPPLQSISSITYDDYLGVPATYDVSNYIVDIWTEPGQVVLAYMSTWPTYTPKTVNSVAVNFVCGYGTSAEDVPEPIRQSMLIALADLYENPQDITTGIIQNLKASMSLLSNYRIFQF